MNTKTRWTERNTTYVQVVKNSYGLSDAQIGDLVQHGTLRLVRVKRSLAVPTDDLIPLGACWTEREAYIAQAQAPHALANEISRKTAEQAQQPQPSTSDPDSPRPKLNYGKLIRLRFAAERWEIRLFRAASELRKLRRQIKTQERKLQ